MSQNLLIDVKYKAPLLQPAPTLVIIMSEDSGAF